MAVYTHVSPAELAAFLASYAIGEAKALRGIAEGVENSNFLLETTEGKYILTVYEKRVNAKELPFFLGLMNHLARQGIPCPVPIQAQDGGMLKQLCGKPAAIVSFLEGKSVKALQNMHLAELGRGMARMHLASQGFALTRANNFTLAAWHSLFESVRDHMDSIKIGFRDETEAQLRHLSDHWPNGLPSGVIHGDLFPDNAFFLGDKLSGIIDFYFACNDAWMYDLAITLNAWCFEPGHAFNITKAKALLSSYHKIRPITDQELALLPILASGAAMRFLLTRTYDWLNKVDGALVKPKDPLEYLAKLRFHQGVKGPEAYGL